MRRKINDAFRRPKNTKSRDDEDRASVTSEDSGGSVNEEGKNFVVVFVFVYYNFLFIIKISAGL